MLAIFELALKREGKQEGLRQGLEQGLEKGRQESERKKARDVALAMLQAGLDPKLIVQVTELAPAEITKLKTKAKR
ncbi:MAG: hypothetical protein AAF471_01325 [Myxococcota bacterium]